MRLVATPVPSTAGILYSRATIDPWARTPPTSVTSPRTWENSGVHAGVVVGHTRIVPGSISEKCARLHLREVGRRMNDAGGSGHPTGADGEATQPRTGGLVV